MVIMEEKKFREFLDKNNLIFTPERKMILEQIAGMGEHFEAEDIVAGLRDRGKRVSRASVYRTLPFLVESGLLREVHSAEKHSHYEHIFGSKHHDHLICQECGKTIEFSDPEIERHQANVCEVYGFQPTSHKLEITGICRECTKKQ